MGNLWITMNNLWTHLKVRIVAAAERAGITSHNFILQAVTERAEQKELRDDVNRIAEERYARIVTTGKTIPWQEMRKYLEDRVVGKTVRRPLAKKPAR